MGLFRQFKVAVLAAFFLSAPAWANDTVANPSYFFPGTTIALEDGDIILTESVVFSSGLIREFGRPAGRYSHASVYIEFPNKAGQMVSFNEQKGAIVFPPENILSPSGYLGLLRPTVKPPVGALATAFEQLAERPLAFDLDMVWPDIDSHRTYCVGFISQLFRLAGLQDSDPYPRPDESARDPSIDWAQKHLGFALNRIVSPNAILSNPHYKLLAQYEAIRPIRRVKHWITETTLRKMANYVRDDHLAVAPPKLGSRLGLAAIKLGLVEDPLLFNIPEGRAKIFATVHDFASRVEQRVNRYMQLHDDQVWDEGSVRELTQAVADYYRDDFFVQPKKR